MSDEEVMVAPPKAKFNFVADDSDSDDGAPASAPAPAEEREEEVIEKAPAKKEKGGGGGGGGAGGKGKKGKKEEEEDWEALLEAEAAANGAAGGGAGEEKGLSKAAEKRKKKKGGAAEGGGGEQAAEAPAAAPPAALATAAGGAAKPAASKPLSKVAQLALERKAREEADEARRKAEEAAAQAAYEAEVARVAEEERRELEKKAKKAEDKRAKKEAAIKEGTYLTKKQREEAAKLLARLDAMRAAGMVVEGLEAKIHAAQAAVAQGEAQDAEEEGASAAAPAAAAPAAAAPAPKRALVYDSRKKKPAASGGAAAAAPAAPSAAPAKEDQSDHWDAEQPAAEKAAAPSAPLVGGGGAPGAAEAAVEDDWEAAADSVAAVAAAAAASAPTAAAAESAAGASGPSGGKKGGGGGGASSAPPSAAPAAPLRSNMSLAERIVASRERRAARLAEAQTRRSRDSLRSPICVVLGHVDTGKTSLLDKIRRTNVQEGEAGGITQQIGATFFPMEALKPATDKLNRELNLEYKVPGLLVVDTPGHEQFTNLRSRGSSLCDIAVLVVDIMVGLERQTLESLELLRQRKTPFVVALNKVDRMFGWKARPNSPIRETLAEQQDFSVEEFERRTQQVLGQMQGQGFNAKLYYENDDFRRVVSVVPTSAHTGEGVPDLLMLLVQLTQSLMSNRIMLCDAPQASVLEVKTIDGLGTTVDIVLVNGEIREGDTLVACGMAGPIVTTVRALLTPPPMREMRVKSEYVHHKSIKAAMGIKIVAADLELAVAGTELLIAHPEDEIEDLKQEVMGDFEKIMKGFERSSAGVYVQASTLGSLEALLQYLKTHKPPVPVASVGIGPLHKKDVVVASVMLERRKEFATILAFDVKVTPEAAAEAESLGVRIFTADIIYHLTDQFSRYLDEATKAKQAAVASEAVFPCILKIIPTAIFNKKDPIVLGVDVLEGKLRIGTPLCVVLPPEKVFTAGGLGAEREAAAAAAAGGGGGGAVLKSTGPNVLVIGKVASMEVNHATVQEVAPGGQSVCVKIEQSASQNGILYGRHFDHTNHLLAHISRGSIDILKEHFADQLTQPVKKCIVKLKDLLKVL